MQADIANFRGQLRNLAAVNDCFRKELEDLKRCNTALKWKKCDLEKEMNQLCSTADSLRQRVKRGTVL